MKRDDCLNRLIQNYIAGNDTRVRFVNVVNPQDIKEVVSRLSIMNNSTVYQPKHFSLPDETLQLANLFQKLQSSTGTVILQGFTSQIALQGTIELQHFLQKMASFTSSKCKVIILCYQCAEELHFPDSRQRGLVYQIDGDVAKRGVVHLLGEGYPIKEKVSIGIENTGAMLEKGYQQVWIRTKKCASDFAQSLWTIKEHRDVFDALCFVEGSFGAINREWGSSEQWATLLEKINEAGSWNTLLQNTFGTVKNLEIVANIWKTSNAFTRWLYTIALALVGTGNDYLNLAVQEMESPNKFVASLFHALLSISWDEPAFANLYTQRKTLLANMKLTEDNELFGYIRMTAVHSANGIRYLTDATMVERKQIISLLASNKYERNTIREILNTVYPDLAAYLSPCLFKEGQWLEEYFEEYRFSKVTNCISDKLTEMAEKQAVDREYNLLPMRTIALSGLPKSGSYVYWIDAMGVEFLAFIREKCKEYGLIIKTSVCCANLPTLTSFNKEFWTDFPDSQKSKVSELDDIKHHGKEDYDYQKSPLPIHLSRELEIIDEVLRKAKQKLLSGEYKRVLILSDHGASRMPVIKENIINIDVNSRGTHYGRVCEYTDSVAHVPYAVKEGDWYILASYDRFKGGQKSSVEVHGGATPEEVLVPVIQLSVMPAGIKIRLMTPVVEYSFKQEPMMEIFSKTTLEQPRILFDSNWIEGQPGSAPQFYAFKLPKKKGPFSVSVYDGETELASDFEVTVKNKVAGMNPSKGGIL